MALWPRQRRHAQHHGGRARVHQAQLRFHGLARDTPQLHRCGGAVPQGHAGWVVGWPSGNADGWQARPCGSATIPHQRARDPALSHSKQAHGGTARALRRQLGWAIVLQIQHAGRTGGLRQGGREAQRRSTQVANARALYSRSAAHRHAAKLHHPGPGGGHRLGLQRPVDQSQMCGEIVAHGVVQEFAQPAHGRSLGDGQRDGRWTTRSVQQAVAVQRWVGPMALHATALARRQHQVQRGTTRRPFRCRRPSSGRHPPQGEAGQQRPGGPPTQACVR